MTADTVETALNLAKAIQNGDKKAVDVVNAAYGRIEKTDETIGSFLHLTKEQALKTAEAVDQKAAAGDTLPLLAGVPIAIKDNMNLLGTPCTCGSKILEGYISPYNATVVEKLQANLLPIVGKTNLDEFAMGSSTENSALQVTRNPWDTERVPGGSSGGSATAVSSAQTLLSLGSDTGGSVRQPASLCGIVGLKPTYGLVSRYGLVAYGSSLDQISPFARNVKDTAAILEVVAGFDAKDSTSLPEQNALSYVDNINPDISGKKIGVIKELMGDGLQPDVAESFQKAIETLKQLGAEVSEISISGIGEAISAYYVLATAEASSNLSRFDGVRYGLRVEHEKSDIHTMYKETRGSGFGPEVKRRIMLGTFVLSSGYYDAYYGKAQKLQKLLKESFNTAFSGVDALICPTSPTTAFKLGEKTDDPVSMYLSDIATIPANITGIPAMNIPCGFDKQGLPIGIQFLGPHLSEQVLFGMAAAFEAETGLANLTPESLLAVSN